MVAGSLGIVLMLFLGPIGGGQLPTDLVSYMDPSDYFFSRRIEGGPKSMLELATKKPSTSSDTLVQLLAIRWLSENPDKLAEHKDAATKAIKQLADGPAGFAKDCALRGLAKMDGKPQPVLHTFPKGSVRGEALSWFPEDINLFGAFDLRAPPDQKTLVKDEELDKLFKKLHAQAMKALPPEAKEEIYKFAEAVGNLRVDRIAAGFAPNPGEARKSRIYVRFTGLTNGKGLTEYLGRMVPDAMTEETKGPQGELISLIHSKRPPAFAVVGDTDFIMAGHEGNDDGNLDLVKHVLDIRAGKKTSLVKGPLGKELEEAPAEASGVGRGVPPTEIQTAIAQSPVGVSPLRVALDLVNNNAAGKGLILSFRATMVNEDDAKKFADGMNSVLKMGREEMKNVPPGIKKEVVEEFGKLLESIEFKPSKTTVSAGLTISPRAQRAVIEMIESWFTLALPTMP